MGEKAFTDDFIYKVFGPKIAETYNAELDAASMNLFGRHAYSLNINEEQLLYEFISDCKNPEWRQLEYFGIKQPYFISNTGIVTDLNSIPIKIHYKKSNYGYTSLRLIDSNGFKVSKNVSIHRLVAQAFIPNPENKPEVNHIIPKPEGPDWYRNLEWVTHEENINWAIKLGHQIMGSAHKKSKCTEEQIMELCKLLEKDEIPLNHISKMLGIPLRTITHIRKDDGWKHVTCKFNFSRQTKKSGPRYSLLSLKMIDMVKDGMEDDAIVQFLQGNYEDAKSMTPKQIKDRIYHIRHQLSSGTLNDYRPTQCIE